MKRQVERGDRVIFAGIWSEGTDRRYPERVPSILIRAGGVVASLGKKQGHVVATSNGATELVRIFRGDPYVFHESDEALAIEWAREELRKSLAGSLRCAESVHRNWPSRHSGPALERLRELYEAEPWKGCPVIRTEFGDR